MRRLRLAAVALFALPALAAATAANPAQAATGPVLRFEYYPSQTLANGGTLDMGTGDTSFNLSAYVVNDGDQDLVLGTATLPAGIAFIVDPSGKTVAPGLMQTASLMCNATASGVMTIPSNTTTFSATVTCSLDGTGVPAMDITTMAGDPIPNGTGALTIPSGGSAAVDIHNRGGGSSTLDITDVNTSPTDLAGSHSAYTNYGHVPFGGASTAWRVTCADLTTHDPVVGDFVVHVETEDLPEYTFTVHCVASGSLDDVPTGSGLTMWGSAIAALLLAAGAGLRLTSRRSAAV